MLLETLTMFCGLGAATLVAVPVRRSWLGAGAFAGAFSLAGLLMRFDSFPEAGLLGGLVGIVVVIQLTGRRFFPLAAASSGVLAAIGVSVLQFQGMGIVLAVALCLGIPGFSMFMAATRPTFAPAPVSEGGLFLVLALAVLVASLPAVQSGWEFAGVTNLSYSSVVSPVSGKWIFWSGGIAMVLGGCHALWRRRW